MQNSSQLKSTFNFFNELLYCYKCILLYLKLKSIVELLKTALLATFFTIFIGKLLDDNGKVFFVYLFFQTVADDYTDVSNK